MIVLLLVMVVVLLMLMVLVKILELCPMGGPGSHVDMFPCAGMAHAGGTTSNIGARRRGGSDV